MSEADEGGAAARTDPGDHNVLLAVLARERGGGFGALGGSQAEIAVPVRQALVDRLLARALASRSASVEVELLEGARLGVAVTHRVLGLPVRARTVLEVEREVDLKRQQVVLHHDDGVLWKTIRTVASTLGVLPQGVTFGAGTVQIDLRSFATRGGWADLLPLVRRLVIHGPADRLFALEADLAVPEAEAGAAPRSVRADRPAGAEPPSASPDAGRSGEDVHEWLRDLAGSRARVDLHVHEALANELLGAARSLAATPGAHTDASPLAPLHWTAFVRDARVRFADRRLLLSVDLEVPDETAT